jgi:hypothetical protein
MIQYTASRLGVLAEMGAVAKVENLWNTFGNV